MANHLAEAEAQFSYTQSLRRDFHKHPELGFQEIRTAGIVARELNSMGLEVTTGVGVTGIVGILEGKQSGPVVLVRFDMDALPIGEETGVPYASRTPGVMHACGHDGHTAIGLSVARILSANRHALAGTVKFIFQPAEEIASGAQAMVDDGVLTSPRPDFALAMHLWNVQSLGWLGAAQGPVMAAADGFRVRIEGQGGHGASPHQTKDPIIAATQIIAGFQTIVSRNISPLKEAVVSVTQIHGGSSFNVIPPTVEFEGTLRSFAPDVRETLRGRLVAILENITQAMDCKAEIEFFASIPPVVNDSQVTGWVAEALKKALPDHAIDPGYQTMGSEDMAVILNEIPGCYIFVGSANQFQGKDAPHHHPKFDFDEAALPLGVAVMSAAIEEILTRGRR